MLGSTAKMQSGTLTFKSDDGYVVSAPVEWFSVAVDADYSSVYIDDYSYPQSIFKTSESVNFTATLKYGESYTIRDLGVQAVKTLAVKANRVDITQTYRSALGVPIGATARYSPKKDETTFKWTERVVVEDTGGDPFER